jgi:glycosyltransferase involved in cell wall biosynthesis
MKKVLVVADCDFWAFAKIYRGIKKYVTSYQVDVHYTDKSHEINHKPYDVVLYLVDHIPSLIFEKGIPREKLIWAIRWGLNIPDMGVYNDKGKLARAKILAVSNKALWWRFAPLHQDVRVAPGGVDTDIFSFKDNYELHNPVRVGWSGSYTGRPKDYRGLDIIKAACEIAGMEPKFALREKRLRKEHEMVEYYHNDIDIYVEMSADAGRQNGLVEAGSCGLPVISSKVGIAKQLLDGTNGILCNRDAGELAVKLALAIERRKEFGRNIRSTIEKTWSWKVQAKIFEQMFNDVVGA